MLPFVHKLTINMLPFVHTLTTNMLPFVHTLTINMLPFVHTLTQLLPLFQFFTGNSDDTTPVMNMFDCPTIAKCIRVNPLGWNNGIAMRVGLLGCALSKYKHPFICLSIFQ